MVAIETTVRSKANDLKVEYKLYRAKAGWRVWDVEIQGVSLVKSYRAQYDEVLASGSPDDLLAKMREHAATGG
jgi:phospholipid transport system substrate-binding protein